MQYVDYVSIKNAMKNIMISANTTTATYDLSNSLTSRIKVISDLDPNIEPLMISEYPYIFIEFDSRSSEHAEFGSGKICDRKNIIGSIHCIWDEMDKSNADDNLMRMVRNVETVFTVGSNRTLGCYNTLGAFINDVHMDNAVFNTVYSGGDSPYNKTAKIGFNISLHVKDL